MLQRVELLCNSLFLCHIITKKGYFMNRVLKLIRGEAAFRQGIFGTGISVAVLDTGVFPHLAIKDRIVSFKDYQTQRIIPYDDNGHGTHILGIIGGNLASQRFYGVAPGCRFHVYKILNQNGNGKIQILTEAIWDVIARSKQEKVHIINISIGVAEHLASEEYEKLNHAIDEAWKRGIVVVAAAGNNGPMENTVTLPGINKRVITVGCSDDKSKGMIGGLKKGYSGIGPTSDCVVKPEVLVPGTNIRSCGIQSPNSFSIKSGTSMAAPVVTGMIALLLEKYPHLTPDEVKLKIYHSVTKVQDNEHCWGQLYVDNLLK